MLDIGVLDIKIPLVMHDIRVSRAQEVRFIICLVSCYNLTVNNALLSE
jgi:hypothetical protein